MVLNIITTCRIEICQCLFLCLSHAENRTICQVDGSALNIYRTTHAAQISIFRNIYDSAILYCNGSCLCIIVIQNVVSVHIIGPVCRQLSRESIQVTTGSDSRSSQSSAGHFNLRIPVSTDKFRRRNCTGLDLQSTILAAIYHSLFGLNFVIQRSFITGTVITVFKKSTDNDIICTNTSTVNENIFTEQPGFLTALSNVTIFPLL